MKSSNHSILEKIHTFTATTALPIVSWNVSKYGSFIYPYFVMNSKGKFFPLSFKTVNERMSLLSTVFCMPCPSSVSSQRLVIRIKLASAFVNILSNWSNLKNRRDRLCPYYRLTLQKMNFIMTLLDVTYTFIWFMVQLMTCPIAQPFICRIVITYVNPSA